MMSTEAIMNTIDHVIDSRGQVHYGFTIVFRDASKVRRIVPTRMMVVSDEAKDAFKEPAHDQP